MAVKLTRWLCHCTNRPPERHSIEPYLLYVDYQAFEEGEACIASVFEGSVPIYCAIGTFRILQRLVIIIDGNGRLGTERSQWLRQFFLSNVTR